MVGLVAWVSWDAQANGPITSGTGGLDRLVPSWWLQNCPKWTPLPVDLGQQYTQCVLMPSLQYLFRRPLCQACGRLVLELQVTQLHSTAFSLSPKM